ncbi:hypothetical protein CY34DRAFT_807218 [Suillus luteus UH-Slu-Lm8-n1]|uniref:Uncharacterized protein n=1 Tax=Suillus luteus UH-Slu-Lm8-n1 TaxID=930992 RepID=A0A0D0B9T5_9AGAM|nr:hypothetical protein CY34DRAFT_807218 [Suillus luteus UH-Slu-Lm8-n1]
MKLLTQTNSNSWQNVSARGYCSQSTIQKRNRSPQSYTTAVHDATAKSRSETAKTHH